MPIPDIIEIVPVNSPVRAEISVPGSKSITNRALVLAALSDGETTLEGALWSEDTQVMVESLQDLGFMVTVAADPNDPSNRVITVYGQAGNVPRGGTEQQPLELFVGNAGTAARFLTALVCLGQGVYRLSGVPRMHERPQAELFAALRELGYTIKSSNDRLPVLVYGGGPRAGSCRVSIKESSQFASALLLCARKGGWDVEVVGENEEEAPYVGMTRQMLGAFPREGGLWVVEPDASSGSYFSAAGHILKKSDGIVTVRNWPESKLQIDGAFPRFLPLPERVSRQTDLGDSIMTAIVIAALQERARTEFSDLGRLRVQECERVQALRTELTKCGVVVQERGDSLIVQKAAEGMLHGAEIETYNDHRMAMCFAILGLRVPGITIRNPACVKKTFPNFFQKLAEPIPRGLGARILDAKTGRMLEIEELFAG